MFYFELTKRIAPCEHVQSVKLLVNDYSGRSFTNGSLIKYDVFAIGMYNDHSYNDLNV